MVLDFEIVLGPNFQFSPFFVGNSLQENPSHFSMCSKSDQVVERRSRKSHKIFSMEGNKTSAIN